MNLSGARQSLENDDIRVCPHNDTHPRVEQASQITISTVAVEAHDSLSAIAPTINERLNRHYSREDKQTIAGMICDWLLERGRLLSDISNPEEPSPYLLLSDGKAVALTKSSLEVKLAIADAGLNMTEAVFGWTISELQHRCRREGKNVRLSKFTSWHGGKLYISSGPTQMVVVENRRSGIVFTIAPNGYDDILFSAEGCLPPWTPTEQPSPLTALNAFQPILEAPAETPVYTPEVQSALSEAWVLAVLMRVRPLPILVNLGQHGSGKSTHAKAIIKLLMGQDSDLATTPCSPRDFTTCATSLQIYGLDNLDGAPEKWLPDLLAQTSTGGMVEERLLYTNGEVYQKALVSALLITTRTAAFASRPDILDRAIPLFFGNRTDFSHSEKELMDEVVTNRDAILTGLAINALRVNSAHVTESSPDNRFTEFGRIVFALWPDKAREILTALNKAKRLSVNDGDSLLQAFLQYKGPPLYAKATQIIKALDPDGDRIEYLGGGQKIARRLRELMPSLRLQGWVIKEGKGHGTSMFGFTPPKKT